MMQRMDIMKKRRLRFRHVLIILILVYVGYTVVDQQMMINRLNEDIAKYSMENKKIEDANAILKDQIQYAGTDEFLERAARERMGLVKPGETVYIIDVKE